MGRVVGMVDEQRWVVVDGYLGRRTWDVDGQIVRVPAVRVFCEWFGDVARLAARYLVR